MEHDEMVSKISTLEGSMKTIFNRVDGVEIEVKDIKTDNKILHEMNTNIAVLATEYKHQGRRIESIECDVKDLKNRPIQDTTELETDVKELKDKPGKRWNTFETVVITAIVTSIIALIASKVFGG